MNQQKLPKGGNHLVKGTKMKGIKDIQTTVQNVNIKIDPVVKGAAEGVLSGMGLNMSAYIGMCLRQVAQDRKVPFTQSVDPDFWIAESKVGEAKTYIESGAFSAAFDLYLRMKDEFNDSCWKASLSAYADRDSDIPTFLMSQLAEAEAKTDLSSVSNIISAGDALAVKIRSAGELSMATWKDDEAGEGGKRFCDAYAEGVESAAKKASETVAEALESEASLRSVIDCEPSNLTTDEKASVLDYIISTVLDVASEHPSNLSMRFIGSGGQSELAHVFDALKATEDYREWLSKADERLQKSKDEVARREEVSHQHLLDMIRASKGIPSVQNLTQVMPKPERNLSPEEMIEQAETIKEVMRILNDENED